MSDHNETGCVFLGSDSMDVRGGLVERKVEMVGLAWCAVQWDAKLCVREGVWASFEVISCIDTSVGHVR